MSDDVHEVYAIRYGHHDRKAAENFIGGDPHDVLQPLDFYVWAIVGKSGTIVLDTGFDAADGQEAPARADQAGRRRPQGDRHRPGGGRDRHRQPHALRPRRQLRPVSRAHAITCRTARWPTPPAAACATRALRAAVRGRRRGGDGAQGVRRPRRLPRRRGRDRARRHRAPYRRPLEGAAERAGEDAARPRGAGGRRLAISTPISTAGASSRSPTTCTRWSKATRRSRSSPPRAITWCPATIRWCSRAIRPPSPASKAGWCGWTPIREIEHLRAANSVCSLSHWERGSAPNSLHAQTHMIANSVLRRSVTSIAPG